MSRRIKSYHINEENIQWLALQARLTHTSASSYLNNLLTREMEIEAESILKSMTYPRVWNK
jgi:hypothetical protein